MDELKNYQAAGLMTTKRTAKAVELRIFWSQGSARDDTSEVLAYRETACPVK